jgi:hypothetical protein
MRICAGVVLFLIALLPWATRDTAAQESSLWSPAARPAACQTSNAHLIAEDVSKSMLKDRLFSRAVRQISAYLDTSPGCTYVLLCRFGTTADVVADGYPIQPGVREQLKRSLFGLRATHNSTNFDEIARLVEWVQMKLATTPDGPSEFRVTVVSDDLPSPDPGKRRFSLQRFFEQRLAGKHVKLVEAALTAEHGSTTRIEDPNGYVLISTSTSGLGGVLSRPAPVETMLAESASTKQAPASALPHPAARLGAPARFVYAGLAVLLAVSVGLVVVTLRRGDRDLAPPPAEDGKDVPPPTVTALVVTEREWHENDHAPRVIRENLQIPVRQSTAVTFGTDSARHTCVVAPVAGIRSADLFSITPSLDDAWLEALDGALCNGKPMPRRGCRVLNWEPFAVRIADREWRLILTADVTSGDADRLFERIQEGPEGKPPAARE